MSHVTSVHRKPKGIAAEQKDTANAETKVTSCLEIQEGKKIMVQKNEYMNVYKKAGTAQVVRLNKSQQNWKSNACQLGLCKSIGF